MMRMRKLEPIQCETLVVGGGIAGCWTALKLVESGLDTVLVCYENADRGGRICASSLSVGAINTSAITRKDYFSWIEEIGRGQAQTSVAATTRKYLAEELLALQKFDPLTVIDLGVALSSGNPRKLLDALMQALTERGVRIFSNAWVVALDASESQCRGVQYQMDDAVGSICAPSIVLASGGYAGLFQETVKTGNYGAMQGRFLLSGGKLSNLEFISQHGYGLPDLDEFSSLDIPILTDKLELTDELELTEKWSGVEKYNSNNAYLIHQSMRSGACFSMGGIMHHDFRTNLKHIFVNGEVMHDYGAHQVAGLPWALYLSAARKIAADILTLKKRDLLSLNPVHLQDKGADFDGDLLSDIQRKLVECHQQGGSESELIEGRGWCVQQRLQLDDQGRQLDDCYAWLTLAEAIFASSVSRRETRGCFIRRDYGEENFRLRRLRTITSYDKELKKIRVNSVDKAHILDLVANQGKGKLNMELTSEKHNAAYFLLKRHLDENRADYIALEYQNRKITYAGLNQLVDQYAFYIFSQGLTRGDKVAIFLRDSPDWVAIFIACLQLGMIAVLVNTAIDGEELTFYLRDAQASVLFTEQELLNSLDVAQIFQEISARIIALEDLLPLQQNRLTCCVPVDERTPGFILYTSGSTGKPKGVLHKHSSLKYCAETFAASELNVQPGDRFFSSARLFFAYGLGNSLIFPLYFGGTSVLVSEELPPAAILTFLQENQITHLFLNPALYNALLSGLTRRPLAPSVRMCVSSGAPLPVKVGRAWAAATQRIILDGVGCSESLHIFCCSHYFPNGDFTLGKIVFGYQLELLDDKNFVISKREVVGNLAVRGGSIAIGYWRSPEATVTTFIQDLLLTDDQYQWSSAGHLNYVGSREDMFKVSGLWLSAFELEQTICELDYVADAAFVVYCSDNEEQKTAAFITPRNEVIQPRHLHQPDNFKQALAYCVRNDLAQSLSPEKLPQDIYVLSELPRTEAGKLSKHQLKELAKSCQGDSGRQTNHLGNGLNSKKFLKEFM